MSASTRVQSARILRVYRSASAAQADSGLTWYERAHDAAVTIAQDTGLPIVNVVGIIAALSPQNPWGHNVRWAAAVASGDETRRGLGMSLARAIAARDASSADTVLAALGGDKVRAFFHAILTQGMTDQVVIDRHAYDIATGQRGSHESLTPKRYADAARAYQAAARRLQETGEADVTASQLQAITWVTWRARYWADGAYDA